MFALESHLDEVARAIGMDPVAFRLHNLVVEGDETAFGEHLQEVRARETLQAAAEAAGYGTPKAANVGRGVGIGDRGPGGGQGSSQVTLRPDGSVLVHTPIFDQGTGTYTTLRQVVSEELGVDPAAVQVEVWNTDAVSIDSGIGGSRGTRVNSLAAYEACQDAKRALARLAAERLGWSADGVIFAGNRLRNADGATTAWPELVAQAGETVSGSAQVNDTGASHITSFCVQIAEVAVDPETGEVDVRQVTTAHDVGQIINPIGHQGQINGGFMQGFGYALMEELRVDDGRVSTLSFGEYKIPAMPDIPILKTVLLESESGVGPYNVKGIGESPIGPVAPAIANAIEDAVGVRIRDLPITAEKVLAALKAKRGH
jgi:CO/xanthine dehydrogenase Mo-binding subunit